MAIYSTRAEWLEEQSRDHSRKLGSLTIKTANAHAMGKFAAHKFVPEITKTANFNAVLLDIIERSKPNELIKSAALRATLNDEGILKVASEDSYWASAHGACHLSFLSGVWDVDPDMAWTFAKNAGLEKEAGIGGVGKLIGRGFSAFGRSVGRGASAVAGDAVEGAKAVGQGASWLGRSIGRGASAVASDASALNPFMRQSVANPAFREAGASVARGASGIGGGAAARAARTTRFQTAGGASRRTTGHVMPRQAPAPAAAPAGGAGAAAPAAAPAASGGAGVGAAGHVTPPAGAPPGTAKTGGPWVPPQYRTAPAAGAEAGAGAGAAGHVAPPVGAPPAGAPPVGGGAGAPAQQASTPAARARARMNTQAQARTQARAAREEASAAAKQVAPPATPPVEGAGAAGQVVPSVGREAWETTKAIGRGVRNLGYAGIAGGTVLGAAGLNLVRPNPSPYQYGMGGPTPWMSPQQM